MVEKKSEKDTMNSKIIENEKSTHLKTINGDCIKKKYLTEDNHIRTLKCLRMKTAFQIVFRILNTRYS